MSDNVRSSLPNDYQDFEFHIKGDVHPGVPGPLLMASGWRGGQLVRLVDVGDVDGWPVLELSNGIACCGVLSGSSEHINRPGISNTRDYVGKNYGRANGSTNPPAAGVLFSGGRFMTRVYETTSLNGGGVRSGPPLVYTGGALLYASENGLLTCDSPADIATATGATALLKGICIKIPTARDPRLGVDWF